MTLENLSNNFSTTLSGNGGSITSGATSFLVASSTNAPATPFRARIGPVGGDPTEIVLVTTVASLTWTVTRGVEAVPGTGAGSGQAHDDGDQIIAVITTAGLPATLSDTTVASTQAFSDAAAAGSGPGLARIDHKHGMPASPLGGLGVYGDGSDGTVTFDGSTTIIGLAPSSSTYTLARDVFFAAATINNGVTIITNGFRIFCQGTLTNNGSIQWDGASVNANTSAGASTTSNSLGSLNQNTSGGQVPGTAGGAGVSAAAGNNGVAQTTNPGFGGQGGTGGTGTSGAGGTGGTINALTTPYGSIRSLPQAVMGYFLKASNIQPVYGGTGGGAGGGDATHAGYGGGAGGGIVIVAAKAFAGTGAIHARGGNGGNPSGGSTGNVGGGGGGGGGVVIAVSGSISGGAISGQTVDANGGAKGTPHGTGTDNATAGSTGTVIMVPN